MKLSKKKVVALALAVCLIAILSMGTLAWFTDSDEVTNNFLIGDSSVPADKVFGVDVWEEVDSDRDGTIETVGKGDTTENEAIYDKVLPGEILPKAPRLENTGEHPQYVRAIVTVTEGYTLMEAMMGKWGDASLFLAGTPETWTLDEILFTEDHELVYIYYYNQVLAPHSVTEPVFDAVVIPTELTLEQAVGMDQFQVNVLGQVIQSEHLDPEVDTAKEAFVKYFDAEGTTAGIPEEQILGRGGEDIVIEEPVEIYVVMKQGESVSLTDATINATEAVVSIPVEVTDGVIMIDGLTVTGGGKIVVREEAASTIWVYVNSDKPVTVDGVEVTRANWQDYFVGVAGVDFQSWG